MPTIDTPKILSDPGFLFAAPLGSPLPANTAAGSKFTDAWPAAYIPLGATTEGSTFSDSTTIEPIRAAEFFNPIKYVTTEGAQSIAFALMDFTLQRYRMARNGGLSALVPTSGTGTTAVYEFEPVDPGNEVRIMIGWESLDGTMRLFGRQCIQGGEVSTSFGKAPAVASIPCTFNFERPIGAKPYKFVSTRG